MHINWQLRELNLKIVYYGPASSGKTTNLEQIHSRVDPAHRSEMVSLKTYEDRTLFFDFLQLEMGKICGLTPKIQLYTVPGQVRYSGVRKLVLRGADGVVFVADSAPTRANANIVSWHDMLSHLVANNLSLQDTPIVLQANKQDLLGALDLKDICCQLEVQEIASYPAKAILGEGVLDTLKAITRGVIAKVQRQTAAA
jgi:hypothetical protein